MDIYPRGPPSRAGPVSRYCRLDNANTCPHTDFQGSTTTWAACWTVLALFSELGEGRTRPAGPVSGVGGSRPREAGPACGSRRGPAGPVSESCLGSRPSAIDPRLQRGRTRCGTCLGGRRGPLRPAALASSQTGAACCRRVPPPGLLITQIFFWAHWHFYFYFVFIFFLC